MNSRNTWPLAVALAVGMIHLACGKTPVVRVRVLGLEGCVNATRAAELVEREAATLGVRLELERIVVRTENDARAERFLGSPTVQIEGKDIEPSMRTFDKFTLT